MDANTIELRLGAAYAHVRFPEKDRGDMSVAYLQFINVERQYQRGRGHASKLLKATLRLLDRVGVMRVTLWAVAGVGVKALTQDALEAWYTRHGFIVRRQQLKGPTMHRLRTR